MKFHEFGDKNLPPILLIHGGGSSWWNILDFARLLSHNYHVILPTLNGMVKSINSIMFLRKILLWRS